ncbi:OLC1v1001831C1 [Oldenlandia corymbosa var. corymbosa]|uniref:OLC1v1001831C1 n=1 Tax=Oldenlandia corymbosa var. corymbosa TaxID=529605 RepID=A0AAV1D7E0_OLDCO|nr:OLC1v1001831C1 [Oldenlandia corymbosa var. corymbosa]
MQAIKEKLNDMSHMRKAKAEAKEEEKEEKEMAKTRVQVAKEIRMAKEAEAAMDLHVSKAAEKVAQQEAKCAHNLPTAEAIMDDHHGHHGGAAGSMGHSASMTNDRHHDTGGDHARGASAPVYSTGANSLI